MFSSEKNIETISQLIEELKRYASLRKELLQINLVSKSSRLLSAIVLGGVLFLVFALILLFLSLMCASALSSITGSPTLSYAIVVVVYFVLGIIIYTKRKIWIEKPITKLLASILLSDSTEEGPVEAK